MIEMHSLILLQFNPSLDSFKLVGWFMQSFQGGVVSQHIHQRYWLYLHNKSNLICECAYVLVICQILIAEPHCFISTDSITAWLEEEA